MKCLLKIRDLTESDVNKIFDIADNIESYKESLKGKKLQCFSRYKCQNAYNF